MIVIFFLIIFQWLLLLTEWKHAHNLLLDSNAQEIKDIYGLNGQIEHKLAFLRTHVPKDMKLVLIGHSIGSYFTLQMLKRVPELLVSISPEVTVGAGLWACTNPPYLSYVLLSLVRLINRTERGICACCLYPYLHIMMDLCECMFIMFQRIMLREIGSFWKNAFESRVIWSSYVTHYLLFFIKKYLRVVTR